MRILVTGGAGFIGSHLVEKLVTEGHTVSVLDDFNNFYAPETKRHNLASVLDRIEVHTIDLRDGEAVRSIIRQGNFDQIVHLGARAGVRPSIQEPELYLDTNIKGTFHVLEGARLAKVPRIIFASSSSVYGLCQEVPFNEKVCIQSTISPYAATKLACEQLCSNYAHLYGIRIVCLRFFTVYGPRQRPDLAIYRFTERILAGKPIDQYGDGTTRRDYTYVDDIIQGVMASLDYDGPVFDIFNLGECETTTLKELIEAIESELETKAIINQLPEQPGDVPLTCADISKARKLLGYNPHTPISKGIPKFVKWFLEHKQAVVPANV